MAVGDIGKRIRAARESTRPIIEQSEFARMLGVSQPRLSNWERGKHDPPSEVILSASRILKQPVEYFYGEQKEDLQSPQKSVYYTDVEGTNDSEPDPANIDAALAFSDPRTIRARASVVDFGGVWSAKGAQREIVNIYAYLSPGREVVKLQDQKGPSPFSDGTVLVFQPDDYPHVDTYILWENRTDPDLRTIRYIDPTGDPNTLVSDSGDAPLRLADWRPIGLCTVEVQGASTPVPRVVIRGDGFGPRKR